MVLSLFFLYTAVSLSVCEIFSINVLLALQKSFALDWTNFNHASLIKYPQRTKSYYIQEATNIQYKPLPVLASVFTRALDLLNNFRNPKASQIGQQMEWRQNL